MTDPLSSLPVVPDAVLPADVRHGSAADKKTYAAALGFEQQLLEQLTQSIADTAQPDASAGASGDGSDDGSDDTGATDAATSAYQQMLPQQLADAMIAGGGTGLADDLYRALRQGRS